MKSLENLYGGEALEDESDSDGVDALLSVLLLRCPQLQTLNEFDGIEGDGLAHLHCRKCYLQLENRRFLCMC